MTPEQRRRNRIAGLILVVFVAAVFAWTLLRGSSLLTGGAALGGPMSDDLRDASQRKLSFLQTLKAVGWGCSACARARATRKTAPGSTRYT